MSEGLMTVPVTSPSRIQDDWRDRYEWPTEDTWVASLTRWAVSILLRAACRLDVVGFESVPATGPLIVAANHLHSFDAFLMGAVFPRKVLFLSRENAYRFPPMGWFLRMCGAFPIKRGQADQWSLDRSLEILKQGGVLGMFPEGRVQHDTGMAVAKTGVATLASRSGAPILPIAITGTDALAHWPNRGRGKMKVGLKVGSLLKVGTDPEPDPEWLRSITDELMLGIASLLPPAYRGVCGR